MAKRAAPASPAKGRPVKKPPTKAELAKAKEELEARVRERTEELASANAQLRQEVLDHARAEQDRMELVRRIVGTQEEERRRISRELHDQLGQLLTAMRLQLESLTQETGISSVHQKARELMDNTRQVEEEIDFLAWELRPSMLDDLGLEATLESYIKQWSEHSGIPVRFHTQGFANRRLTSLLETNLYRIVQEALNNAVKHSQATNIEILLEPRANDAVLIVEDNGRGFTVVNERDSAGRGIGLAGIRERAALMKGNVEIESTEGKGTTIFVRIPLRLRTDGSATE